MSNEESTFGDRMRDADYRRTSTGANLSKKELKKHLDEMKALLALGAKERENGKT